jgi:starch synthase
MTISKSILMVAAENDALENAKVGGIGDVVRDIPVALAQMGCKVSVVVPSYGVLHSLSDATHIAHYTVLFAGKIEQVNLYRIPLSSTRHATLNIDHMDQVTQWVIDHPAFSPCGVGRIYCNDSNDRPFATDASKFALFSAAVGQGILNSCFGPLDVLHLHDWHAAVLAVLREYDPHYVRLKTLHTVYSVHNLALQGIRPLKGDASSLQGWFANLQYDQERICDPVATHCFNPMRAAIELADKVHAVSPTYATEIQQASHHELGVYGGEGLETYLRSAAQQNRLQGILNGCEYPAGVSYTKLSKSSLIQVMQTTLMHWASRSAALMSAHWLAWQRIENWQNKRERGFLVTSVGRITDQKMRILKLVVLFGGKRQSVLEHLLDLLIDKGTLILLGAGDESYQAFLLGVAGKNANLIYLQGYADDLPLALYQSGDLFLMPSSFEPCGISQMLAMRAGQPCLVHGVGGLNDTVIDDVNGFMFRGETWERQGQHLIERFQDVLQLAEESPNTLTSLSKAAAKARFTWASVAEAYLARLYQ